MHAAPTHHNTRRRHQALLGVPAAADRYEHELAPLAAGVAFDGEQHSALWRHVEDFTPHFLEAHPDGAVVRVSCTLKGLEAVMVAFDGPAIARAGSGICYGYFDHTDAAAAWMDEAVRRGWRAVIEFSPEARKSDLELWPAPAGDLATMRRVKELFDPGSLLNRGRLYRRI